MLRVSGRHTGTLRHLPTQNEESGPPPHTQQPQYAVREGAFQRSPPAYRVSASVIIRCSQVYAPAFLGRHLKKRNVTQRKKTALRFRTRQWTGPFGRIKYAVYRNIRVPTSLLSWGKLYRSLQEWDRVGGHISSPGMKNFVYDVAMGRRTHKFAAYGF